MGTGTAGRGHSVFSYSLTQTQNPPQAPISKYFQKFTVLLNWESTRPAPEMGTEWGGGLSPIHRQLKTQFSGTCLCKQDA